MDPKLRELLLRAIILADLVVILDFWQKMVVQGLAGWGAEPPPGGLRTPGPPVSAQHWVEFLEHF